MRALFFAPRASSRLSLLAHSHLLGSVLGVNRQGEVLAQQEAVAVEQGLDHLRALGTDSEGQRRAPEGVPCRGSAECHLLRRVKRVANKELFMTLETVAELRAVITIQTEVATFYLQRLRRLSSSLPFCPIPRLMRMEQGGGQEGRTSLARGDVH